MWTTNARVLAKSPSEPFWYPGTIRHAEDLRCYVILDNGEDGWFAGDAIRSLDVPAGCEVLLKGKGESEPRPATIERLEQTGPLVRTTSGDSFVAQWASVQVPLNSLTQRPRSKKTWQIGDRVFARWGGDLFWYPGTIFAKVDAGYRIVFDDQDKAVVSADDLVPLAVEVGDKVFCRPKFEPLLRYFPAEITRVEAELIDVQYEEPESEEHNTTVSRLRIRRETGSRIFWEEGDRILASGRDEYWFPAQVLAIDGERTFVALLDGRHGWLRPEEIRTLRLALGMKVGCRKEAGDDYLPATVQAIRGNVIEVQYEDGTLEPTLLSLLRFDVKSPEKPTG